MEGAASDTLIYPDEAFKIRGAVFEAYRAMGAGFLEAVYQECLEIEFARRDLPYKAHRQLPLTYRGQPLRQSYIADFVCYDSIIVELKATRVIAPTYRAQTIHYLRATGLKLGLLVNFGAMPRVEIERFLF